MRSRAPVGISLALLPVLASAAFQVPRDDVHLEVREGSRIWIEGDSNLHPWTCEATRFDPLIRVDRAGAQTPPREVYEASFTVAVAALECGNGKMNENLRKAVGAEANPHIRFALTGAQLVDPGYPGPNHPSGVEAMVTGELTVAGNTRELSMHVSGTDGGDGTLRLQGSARIRMSDWGIRPPTAMLGLLKTDDEMTILVDLIAAYPPAGTEEAAS